jgi:parallel beta-helix repeat protein
MRYVREVTKRRITTKPASCLTLSLILIGILMLAFNATPACAFVSGPSESFATQANPPTTPNVILHQDFDNEVTGSVPKNWSLTNPRYGYIKVDDTVYYGNQGKSAKFVDNSTKGSPGAYRNFTEQNGTIVVSLAVRLLKNVGNNTGLEVRVDNGTSAGANIVFGNGSIQYREQFGQLDTLRTSYVANRWYTIKFIMDIPDNLYNIHIDEHLEVENAKFTGSCNQIHRIVINETSASGGALLPIGYIDNIEVRKGIVIPTDFPTIQEGIDEASPGDVVIVSKNRTYFEDVTIWKNIWLIGQDSHTTIIDGRFAKAAPNRIAGWDCSNVQIYGFTIRYSAADGAQIFLNGSGNIITNNIIDSGLGDGIHIAGTNNYITNNTIRSNALCGIIIDGSNMTVRGNIIQSNDGCGIRILWGSSNSTIVNNLVQDNGIGLKCEVSANNNKIYQNRFVGNVQQAQDYGTTNRWDDGYPYNLTSKKGGGNYWSDYKGIDLYKGPTQDEHGYRCFPSPDGIVDKPYNITSNSIDHYPLFLIQSITQNATLKVIDYNSNVTRWNIDYNTNVTVTAKVLDLTQIMNATLYIEYNGTKHDFRAMKISGGILTATIPRQPYNTTVSYIVGVLAYKANRLNSTSYPIPFRYQVGDFTNPDIGTITAVPNSPNENQTITVYAIVTEPPRASGVAKVFVSYKVGNTSWTAEMTKLPPPRNNNYTAVIPKQPATSNLNFNITAFDKAGNFRVKTPSPLYVKQLAQLRVTYNSTSNDPCSIDLGTVSGDQTISKIFTIQNKNTPSDSTLSWSIQNIKVGPWLTSLGPITSGFLPGGKNVNVTITIDTSKCPDPSLYVVELSVKANGTVPQWAVIESFTVRYIVVDQSWASSQAPNHCDVGTTQYYAFHLKWTNNCSDAIGGSITILCKTTGKAQGPLVANGTGWVNFSNSSNIVMNKTFTVEKVQFGSITAFKQKAHDITTIWDRVYINLSLARDWIDVGSNASVFWNGSHYEYDNRAFNGTPLFKEGALTHHTVGRYNITASSIIDDKYHLTAFKSNTVQCTWDEIEIITGGVSSSQLNVRQTGTVWFTAIYSYTNKLFKGTDGTLYMNHTALIWSGDKEVWISAPINYTTPGTRNFVVTGVEDRVHNLTKISDKVGPLNITWGPSPWWKAWFPKSGDSPTVSQSSSADSQTPQSAGVEFYQIWPLLIIIVAGGIGVAFPLALFLRSGKKHPKITTVNKHPKIATRNSRR